MDTADVERFEANRNRLASLAYRLLGSAADAEDVVQDAYLRWQATDPTRIEVPEAWLTKVVTHLAIDRLRSAKARHERATGDWMPEPLLDGDPMLGPADTVEQRESVTLAMLTLMEHLSPVQRAVYVLREAFAHSHAEIARILDITESASQQHARRARQRLAGKGSVSVVDGGDGRGGDGSDGDGSARAARRIVEAFVDAAASGRTDRLVALLTDDATGVADTAGVPGGKVLRVPTPERLASTLRAGFKPTPAKRRLAGGTPSIHSGVVNGSPAMIVTVEDRVIAVLVLGLRGDKIANVHGMARPDRLRRISEAWRRTEHDAPVVESW